MTHDNCNLQLETGRSRSHPPDRPRATVALVNRELTLADTAEILEIALRRSAARWRMKFAQGISRPSANVIANGASTAGSIFHCVGMNHGRRQAGEDIPCLCGIPFYESRSGVSDFGAPINPVHVLIWRLSCRA